MNRQQRRAAERAAKARDEPFHGPIEAAYHERMNQLAHMLDEYFNPDHAKGERETGFCLLVFRMGEEGRCNYISNANRLDVRTMFRELLARLDGQANVAGTA
jgi:hypothetical protein